MAPKVTIIGDEHITDEKREAARIGLEQYRRWRGLLKAIEILDSSADAALIEAIARVVPVRERSKKARKRKGAPDRASASTPKVISAAHDKGE
jgi:predicted mannosyl-3-phosphoglycerate phosphatase (HAD superfamily)